MKLVVEGVSKEYVGNNGEPVVALKGISLEVPEGEFVCILGPSLILCLVECPGTGKNDRVKSYGILRYSLLTGPLGGKNIVRQRRKA